MAELFLNEQPVDADTLRAAIRRATLALKFQPVLMGSAFKNKGVCVCGLRNEQGGGVGGEWAGELGVRDAWVLWRVSKEGKGGRRGLSRPTRERWSFTP